MGRRKTHSFAFDKALRDGCDGFEFDVRLSSDGRGVVCHDPALHGLEIAQSSFSDLLAARQARRPHSSYGLPNCLASKMCSPNTPSVRSSTLS